MPTNYSSIFNYIVAQEEAYQIPINLNGWSWSMPQHLKTSFFYDHGRLLNGNDEDTPVKNITRPLLNLQKRAEDLDVKDIVLYVDDPDNYHLSFLVKKYHDDIFTQENNIDEFLDEVKESKVVYGGGLAKKMNRARPEVIPLQSIAFCDQTNMLGSPLAFKHFYNPDELKQMEKQGWGNTANGADTTIDEIIALAEDTKVLDKQTGLPIKTPTKCIEVYEVHGTLPPFAEDGDEFQKYEYQFAIVAFYTDSKNKKHGVTLFRKTQKAGNLKLLLRDKIYSRALGFGGAEELFEPQVWTNYSVIRQKDLLDATSKIILKSTDPAVAAKHPSGLKNMSNLEIVDIQEGSDIQQIDTTPRSMILFDKFEQGMKDHAQLTASAFDPTLGDTPPSGTPFKLQDLVVSEGNGLHVYRRKKFAKFIEEVYRDWIIPHIQEQITSGSKFLSDLSFDEMKYVTDCVVRNMAKEFVINKILGGENVTQEQLDAYKEVVRQEFVQKGNKHFIEILKGEFTNKPLAVKISIKGHQKDLAKQVDKLTNIFRQIFASPQAFQQVMQIPGMQKVFNELLEASGLTPGDFSTVSSYQPILSPMQPSPNALAGAMTPQVNQQQ